MLAKKGQAGNKAKLPAAAAVVEPIVGKELRAFRMPDMTDEQREHLLKAKAPGHSRQ